LRIGVGRGVGAGIGQAGIGVGWLRLVVLLLRRSILRLWLWRVLGLLSILRLRGVLLLRLRWVLGLLRVLRLLGVLLLGIRHVIGIGLDVLLSNCRLLGEGREKRDDGQGEDRTLKPGAVWGRANGISRKPGGQRNARWAQVELGFHISLAEAPRGRPETPDLHNLRLRAIFRVAAEGRLISPDTERRG
jgi:hypothetical protein